MNNEWSLKDIMWWGSKGVSGINLVESNRVETKAEIEEADGGSIKEAEEDDRATINGFGLKKMQSLCHMEGEECHHQVPARKGRRCSIPQVTSFSETKCPSQFCF